MCAAGNNDAGQRMPGPAECVAPAQVLGLAALGVRAAALTSLTSKEEAAAISKQVRRGGCWGRRGGGRGQGAAQPR